MMIIKTMITVMYIYGALIDALKAHMVPINLNTIFGTPVVHVLLMQ